MANQSFVSMGPHLVPAFWKRALPEDFFYLNFPSERNSTCQNCPQVVQHSYSKQYRCCTYLPAIPNFSVGAALKDPVTAPKFTKVLEAGHHIPEGIQASPEFYKDSLIENGKGLFGITEKIRCPFISVEDLGCGAYGYRNSVCSTFFCMPNHGQRGAMFWEKIQGIMGQIETALSQWCMEQLGLDPQGYFEAFGTFADKVPEASNLDTRGWSEAIRRELYGPWYGKESEFFMACHDAIESFEGDLHQLASSRQLFDNWTFDRGFQEWLPADALLDFSPVPETRGRPIPIEDLWYEIKLFHRNLWSLPFGDGPVGLSPHAQIKENPQSTGIEQHYKQKPCIVAFQKPEDRSPRFEVYISSEEAAVLRFFRSPKAIDGDLLEEAPLLGLAEPRESLSEWLRRGILTTDLDQA